MKPVPDMTELETLRGTTECPICQSNAPHNHRTLEVQLHDRLIAAERQLDIERSAFMDSCEQSAKALGEARIRIKWLEGRLAEIANDRFMADLEAQVFAWVRDAIEQQNIARAALAPRSERREGLYSYTCAHGHEHREMLEARECSLAAPKEEAK